MESTRDVIILCNKECQLLWYMVRVLRVAGLKYVLRSVNRSLRWFDVRPRTSAIVVIAETHFLKKDIVEISGKLHKALSGT